MSELFAWVPWFQALARKITDNDADYFVARARKVLAGAGRGGVRAAGFLMDMNRVFEGFVRRALREELGLREPAFPEGRGAFLDEAGAIRLRPDLSWWEQGRCVFVGDAKYKRINHARIPNADLYQLLAYATALDLPGGLLIYAKGEREPAVHRVRHSGKQLEVVALDLAGTPNAILAQIGQVATQVQTMASKTRVARAA